jgi:hypothetical protein
VFFRVIALFLSDRAPVFAHMCGVFSSIEGKLEGFSLFGRSGWHDIL